MNFMWLLIMCYDIYSTFSSSIRQMRGSVDATFRKYCLVALGVPITLTSLLILLDNLNTPDAFHPRMGEQRCSLGRFDNEWVALYLYVPVMIISSVSLIMESKIENFLTLPSTSQINVVFYCITAKVIFLIQKETVRLRRGDSQKHGASDSDKDR